MKATDMPMQIVASVRKFNLEPTVDHVLYMKICQM